MTNSQRRRAAADRKGWILIALCVVAFAGMVCGAYMIDAANGIRADQSLRSAGL